MLTTKVHFKLSDKQLKYFTVSILNFAKLSLQITPTFPPFLRILSACADWCSSNSFTSCFSSMPWHHENVAMFCYSITLVTSPLSSLNSLSSVHGKTHIYRGTQ